MKRISQSLLESPESRERDCQSDCMRGSDDANIGTESTACLAGRAVRLGIYDAVPASLESSTGRGPARSAIACLFLMALNLFMLLHRALSSGATPAYSLAAASLVCLADALLA